MTKCSSYILSVLLHIAVGMTLHELDTEGTDCSGPTDPACVMFPDGYDADNELGVEYYQAYHDGWTQGQQACADGETMELNDINSQCNAEVQIDGEDDVDQACMVKAYASQSGYANGYMTNCIDL